MPGALPSSQVAAFLATKLVLWDQRALWLELLLRHPERGSPSRLQLPLKALLLSQAAWPLPSGSQTLEDMLMELFRTLTTRELRVRRRAVPRAVCVIPALRLTCDTSPPVLSA
jgi:hypothetical protein